MVEVKVVRMDNFRIVFSLAILCLITGIVFIYYGMIIEPTIDNSYLDIEDSNEYFMGFTKTSNYILIGVALLFFSLMLGFFSFIMKRSLDEDYVNIHEFVDESYEEGDNLGDTSRKCIERFGIKNDVLCKRAILEIYEDSKSDKLESDKDE